VGGGAYLLSTKDTKGTKRTMCLLPRRTQKARREDFKENSHIQASAPEWSYGAEVMGLPLRASSQAAPSLLYYPFQGSKPVHDYFPINSTVE
jgi:hypothetical protein